MLVARFSASEWKHVHKTSADFIELLIKKTEIPWPYPQMSYNFSQTLFQSPQHGDITCKSNTLGFDSFILSLVEAATFVA